MLCEHLHVLEAPLQAYGFQATFRGQVWSERCREWAYFACVLDIARTRQFLPLADCVVVHENEDPRLGREKGFVCTEHHDAVMGLHPADTNENTPLFPPVANTKQAASAS